VSRSPVDVYVAAGSNVEPEKNLRAALSALRSRCENFRQSPAYRNRAVGFEGADFINLVVGFRTAEPIENILPVLHEIEASCGRARLAPKWAPRSMDLDVLLYGDAVIQTPALAVPRPDLLKRAYMLKPLADIAPDLVHPTAHKSIAELWRTSGLDVHEMTKVEL
jgi:2-amino-4-hydroxy-6-hydroxymethyldihydropteridine diphosphokinase